MPTPNQKTLKSYEMQLQSYIDQTPSEVTGGLKAWIDEALSGLPHGARILELGSGDGRDADYIEHLGYDVECTDAAQGFISCLLAKGFSARLHDAILDPIVGSYDMIFANAVLHHFTHCEAMLVTSKVLAALKLRGRFAFSVKEGAGETWSNEKLGEPRYYHFWTRKQIEAMLKNTGFNRWTIHKDIADSKTENGWLQVIAYK